MDGAMNYIRVNIFTGAIDALYPDCPTSEVEGLNDRERASDSDFRWLQEPFNGEVGKPVLRSVARIIQRSRESRKRKCCGGE